MLPSPSFLPHVALHTLAQHWFDRPASPAYSAVEGLDAGFRGRPPTVDPYGVTADSDRNAVVSEVQRSAVARNTDGQG
jgi:hypothetical protein